MRIIVQRVKKASVLVRGKLIGEITRGLLLFVGVEEKETEKEIKKMAGKILNLRIFGDKDDKMNFSILDIKGKVLVIPQFTLFADCSKGNRPYFGEAAKPEIAKPLFEKFVAELKKSKLKVEKGEFGAKMEVELVNDGPVTIILNSNGQN